MKWYAFDSSKGSRQKRPPVYRQVLVRTQRTDSWMSLPPALAVGYRKDAAGDKQSPYFVVPGVGGTVSEWCDCLPEELAAALER